MLKNFLVLTMTCGVIFFEIKSLCIQWHNSSSLLNKYFEKSFIKIAIFSNKHWNAKRNKWFSTTYWKWEENKEKIFNKFDKCVPSCLYPTDLWGRKIFFHRHLILHQYSLDNNLVYIFAIQLGLEVSNSNSPGDICAKNVVLSA